MSKMKLSDKEKDLLTRIFRHYEDRLIHDSNDTFHNWEIEDIEKLDKAINNTQKITNARNLLNKISKGLTKAMY
jgi:hypothetical protein